MGKSLVKGGPSLIEEKILKKQKRKYYSPPMLGEINYCTDQYRSSETAIRQAVIEW